MSDSIDNQTKKVEEKSAEMNKEEKFNNLTETEDMKPDIPTICPVISVVTTQEQHSNSQTCTESPESISKKTCQLDENKETKHHRNGSSDSKWIPKWLQSLHLIFVLIVIFVVCIVLVVITIITACYDS